MIQITKSVSITIDGDDYETLRAICTLARILIADRMESLGVGMRANYGMAAATLGHSEQSLRAVDALLLAIQDEYVVSK